MDYQTREEYQAQIRQANLWLFCGFAVGTVGMLGLLHFGEIRQVTTIFGTLSIFALISIPALLAYTLKFPSGIIGTWLGCVQGFALYGMYVVLVQMLRLFTMVP